MGTTARAKMRQRDWRSLANWPAGGARGLVGTLELELCAAHLLLSTEGSEAHDRKGLAQGHFSWLGHCPGPERRLGGHNSSPCQQARVAGLAQTSHRRFPCLGAGPGAEPGGCEAGPRWGSRAARRQDHIGSRCQRISSSASQSRPSHLIFCRQDRVPFIKSKQNGNAADSKHLGRVGVSKPRTSGRGSPE